MDTKQPDAPAQDAPQHDGADPDGAAAPGSPRPDGPGLLGRPAAQEFAELLLLRQRPAIVAIGGVVVIALLLASLGTLPANGLVGFVVGVLALLAAVAAMIGVDASDPVVRGPRHVRVTGRTVVGRLQPEPTDAGVAPVADSVVRALRQSRHLRLLVVGVAHDAAPTARAMVRSVASAGHSALLVDLTEDGSGPGVRGVARATHRLADVAEIDHDLQLATVRAGEGDDDAQAAATHVATSPPSDLELLVTVLDEDVLPGGELLAHHDRVLAVVPLGVLDRDDLDRRLGEVEGSRSVLSSVVVVDVPVAATTTDAAGDPVPAGPTGGDALTARGSVAPASRDAAVPSGQARVAATPSAGAPGAPTGGARVAVAGGDDAPGRTGGTRRGRDGGRDAGQAAGGASAVGSTTVRIVPAPAPPAEDAAATGQAPVRERDDDVTVTYVVDDDRAEGDAGARGASVGPPEPVGQVDPARDPAASDGAEAAGAPGTAATLDGTQQPAGAVEGPDGARPVDAAEITDVGRDAEVDTDADADARGRAHDRDVADG